MAPTSEQITVAVEALRHDAATWHTAADDLRDAARVGAQLHLDAFHFSYIGDHIGLTAVYAQLREKLSRLLVEGAENLESQAVALTKAAAGYEEEERNNVHSMNNVY